MKIQRVLPGGGRVPLATRTLLRDRLRLLISVGGIGFAILLVLLLDGLRVGTVAKSTTYIDHVGADVFVASHGVDNMALAASALPEQTEAEAASVEGVAQAAGIVRIPLIVTVDGEKRPVTLIGYDLTLRLGGPWDLRSGRALQGDGEVVVDDALANDLDLDVGDSLDVAGGSFFIVGTSGQTANIAGKHVFVSRDAAQARFGIPGVVNFVLVQIEDGAAAEEVADALNAALPSATATARDQLSENDRDMLGSLFLPPVTVASTVGFLVGLAIIGLTMYTTTAERIRDFGVLKAMGARNAYLFRTVLTQASVLGFLGFLVGLAVAAAVGPIIERIVPDIGVTIERAAALRTLAAVVIMSLLGAVVPVARIVRVDPLVVFRS